DTRLVQQPGERDLRRRDAAFPRDLTGAVDHRTVELGTVEHVGERVAARALRQRLAVRGPASGQQSPRERAPGDHADALIEAERDHLPLLLAIDQVVVVLHGAEARGGDLLPFRDLPRVHAAGADVAGLPGFHDVL